MRILVLEDHPDTAALVARVLTNAGYDVETAQSMAEARPICAGAGVDLLVADIMLGDGDACELMEQLVAAHGQRGLSFSALPPHRVEAKSQAAGFFHHMTKPVEISELLRAVRAALAEAPGQPRRGPARHFRYPGDSGQSTPGRPRFAAADTISLS